jgi:hypothetical protein
MAIENKNKKSDYFIYEQSIKDAVKDFIAHATRIADTKLELFQKVLINPEHNLTPEQTAHITKHAKALCEIKGMADKIKECGLNVPQANPVFLREALKQIERVVFDKSETLKNPDLTVKGLQKQLTTEFSAHLALLEYGNNYSEINELNAEVNVFRKTASSLYAELTEEVDAFEKVKSENKSEQKIYKAVPASFQDKENKISNDTQVAVINKYTKAVAIEPQLHANPAVDAPEAMENLKKSGYFYADAKMGALQVDFVSKVIVPTAVNAICTVKKNQESVDASSDSNFQLSNAFEQLEYVVANFEAIFSGFNTDYYARISESLQKLQDIRITNVGQLGLKEFTSGLNDIFEMNQHVQEQHGSYHKASNIEALIEAHCPQYQNSGTLLLDMTPHSEL